MPLPAAPWGVDASRRVYILGRHQVQFEQYQFGRKESISLTVFVDSVEVVKVMMDGAYH